MAVASVSNSVLSRVSQGGAKDVVTEKSLTADITKLKSELHTIDGQLGGLRGEADKLLREVQALLAPQQDEKIRKLMAERVRVLLERLEVVRNEIADVEKSRVGNITLTQQKEAQRDALKAAREEGAPPPAEEAQSKDERKNPYAKVFGADLSRFNELERQVKRDMLEVMTDRAPVEAMTAGEVSGALFVLDAEANDEAREAADADAALAGAGREGDGAPALDEGVDPGDVGPPDGAADLSGDGMKAAAASAPSRDEDRAGLWSAEEMDEQRRRAMLGEY